MTKNDLVIQNITDPADFQQAAKVIRESFKTVAEEFNLTKKSTPTHPAFLNVRWLREKYRTSESVKFFGMFAGKKQIGFVLVERASPENPDLHIKPGPDAWWIEKLAILPAHRHGGSGAKLVGYALDYIRKQGGKKVVLGMLDESTVLKNWYKKLGFEVVTTRKFSHLPFHVTFMERDVAPLSTSVK